MIPYCTHTDVDDILRDIDQCRAHYLVTTARNLCPRWMNPEHHAHYMDVRAAIVRAYAKGLEDSKGRL